ncbi:ABC transporter permease [Cucumibacter marinus]|uniref:ABC transporter permease n=1 Tax=Cucumibacter marinus TaxID=1121252 RepID=UPI00056C409F|nr:FtsX-like permease family protein [Cucumibacter marinus]
MLDRKLLRDYRRLWAQAAAIGLVAAAGVMTLLLGVGTYRALSETRAAYYERYGFADLFAGATRVPNGVFDRIEAIPGVARADARIQQTAVLEIEGMTEPAAGQILTIPDEGESALNRLFLQKGRLPDPTHAGEVVVSEAFALAHEFEPGDTLSTVMGGVKRTLTITGLVLSPEFIYSVGPGDILPDDKRFGVVWMRYSDAAAAFNLTGAFNAVSIKLGRNANQAAVVDAIDDILEPYGGQGAYGRDEQISHAFLESELTGLEAMSYVLPPIFLGVAAFLVNMTLSRLIALEREQIGLLKALGYRSATIAWHYVKFCLLIAVGGTLLGWAFGAWAARGLAVVYAEFFKFPFLLFQDRPDVFAISGAAAIVSAVVGSLHAVRQTVALSPAVAMAPPAPAVYKRFFLDRLGLTRHVPQGLTMALRSLSRRPVRGALTVFGIALSGGLLVGGQFSGDSMEFMIDATYFRADRQQASLVFAKPVTPTGLESVRRLPGVMTVEPYRTVPVKLKNGRKQKRAAITGKLANADLSRVIDLDLDPVGLPESGLVLSELMAKLLDVGRGDRVEIELLDGSDKTIFLPVSAIVQQYMGVGAYMEIGALNQALGEGPLANGAYLRFDTQKTDELYSAVKALPVIAGITLQRESLRLFRETIGENLGISRAVYVLLSVVIVFGVVYNSMRIQLSERARELASLRVLGFTKAEVSVILLSELILLTLIAIPVGWLLGYGMAAAVSEGLTSELFRIPLYVSPATYAEAALVVMAATAVSAFVVQRRVSGLDMIAVLKTRE